MCLCAYWDYSWVFSCNDFILYVLLLSHVQGKFTNFPTCVTFFYYCIEILTWGNLTEKSMCWFGSGGGFLGWSICDTTSGWEQVGGNGHVVKQKAKERLRAWVYSLFLNHLFWCKASVFRTTIPSQDNCPVMQGPLGLTLGHREIQTSFMWTLGEKLKPYLSTSKFRYFLATCTYAHTETLVILWLPACPVFSQIPDSLLFTCFLLLLSA